MSRIQFYPDKKLENQLTNLAAILEISKSALVVDLLSQIDFDNLLSKTPTPTPAAYCYSSIFSDVKKDVEKRVKECQTGSAPSEFILNDMDSFKNIFVVKAESGNIQPSPVKGSTGHSFCAQVNKGQIANVIRAYTKDRSGNTVLKFRNGSAVYTVVCDVPIKQSRTDMPAEEARGLRKLVQA